MKGDQSHPSLSRCHSLHSERKLFLPSCHLHWIITQPHRCSCCFFFVFLGGFLWIIKYKSLPKWQQKMTHLSKDVNKMFLWCMIKKKGNVSKIKLDKKEKKHKSSCFPVWWMFEDSLSFTSLKKKKSIQTKQILQRRKWLRFVKGSSDG